ncbi:MAG: 30S ribosome-binding factor RbfA [Caldilineaceae bacterium]|nr:30S ribosome-binding factor RbfA [Caldilineaceae bacterium]
MATIRQQRVRELLYQELSILISNELDDPRLSLLTVTNVVVSRDLRNVKVYVYHDDEEETPRRVILRGLTKATPFIRRQLAQRLTLRVVPELTFHYDDTPERAARVDELLQRIRAERAANGDDEATPTPQDVPATPPTEEE